MSNDNDSYRKCLNNEYVLDKTIKDRRKSFMARAVGTANGAWLDPRWKYDHHEDDYIRRIEKHGKISGSKF